MTIVVLQTEDSSLFTCLNNDPKYRSGSRLSSKWHLLLFPIFLPEGSFSGLDNFNNILHYLTMPEGHPSPCHSFEVLCNLSIHSGTKVIKYSDS